MALADYLRILDDLLKLPEPERGQVVELAKSLNATVQQVTAELAAWRTFLQAHPEILALVKDKS